MGLKRYFWPEPLGERFEITGTEYNHMANVMRSRPGEQAIVCNGDGNDYLCQIEEIDKKRAVLSVLSCERNGQEASSDVTAFVGLLKGDNTELEIQKLSELGVRRVVPFFSENTVAKADEKKIERFNRVALESAKQCGRAYCLKVEPAIPFRKIFEREFDALLFCYEAEDGMSIGEALKHAVSEFAPQTADACRNSVDSEFESSERISSTVVAPQAPNVAFVIGSEGGFTPAEAELARMSAVSVSLGSRILRAETAAIAVASVVMYALGEMEAKK